MLCVKLGCKEKGIHSPVLLFWSEGYEKNHDPIEVTLPIPVCDKCKELIGLDDLLTDEGFDSINKAIEEMGAQPLERKTAELSWKTYNPNESEMGYQLNENGEAEDE